MIILIITAVVCLVTGFVLGSLTAANNKDTVVTEIVYCCGRSDPALEKTTLKKP